MTRENIVKIECPECGQENTVPRPWELMCQKCNAQLGSGKYSKRMMSAWTALFLGVGGTIGASQLLNADRYPMNVEHTIIEDCIKETKRPLTYSYIRNKRDVCICALAETQSEFDAGAHGDKNIRNDFMRAFERNAAQCIDK